MSAGLVMPPETGTASLPRKRLTRQEVQILMDAGCFEGQRYELIDGDLIDKMGQNPPHAFAIDQLHEWLAGIFGPLRCRIQIPIEVSLAERERTLPEPDVSVLIERKPEYSHRFPCGDELLLVVEVSDTTASFDLSRKGALYATAGVPEYWVLDVVRRRLVVHRQPIGSAYSLIQILGETHTVSLENRTETIRVSELLPTA